MGKSPEYSTPLSMGNYRFGNQNKDIDPKYQALFLALESLKPLLSDGRGMQDRREQVETQLAEVYSRAVPHLDLVSLMRRAGFSENEMRASLIAEPFSIQENRIDGLIQAAE